MLRKDRIALVARLMEALPLEMRETLVLREHAGLSYEEIVAVTGVPIGTVRSRLARARQLLLKGLDGWSTENGQW